MKAGVLESIGHLAVKEVPDPQLEKGTVILKVGACSICSTDLRIFHYGHARIQLPQILGHEIAGEVTEVGEGVRDHKIGDRVTVTPTVACGECHYCHKKLPHYCQRRKSFGYQLAGGYAEYLFVPSFAVAYGALNRFPDTLSFTEASLAEPLACCIRAQKSSQVGTGDMVAIIGGGPVGIMHARLAKTNGAGRVILIERDLGRLKGIPLDAIDDIIDSTRTDPSGIVAHLTEGRGADVVMVACSSAEAQVQALSIAGSGGRVNFFGGLPPGASSITIDSNIIHYKEVSIQGAHGSLPEDNRNAIDMIARGTVKVSDLISHTFPLDAIVEAFRLAESRHGMHVAICP
ncbi:MAG: zinc-binding dehydrogenase [Chloroflexi bacterium]|nr:zinc-binding dehydrogenase [Chloroflexota bacterium]